jgi:hypothetical protein
MGIAGVEPRQLAPTVGTTGSGYTDLPALSPIIDNLIASTGFGGPASAITVDSTSLIDIDFAIDATAIIAVPAIADTNDKIDTNSAIDAAAVIAAPAVVDTNNKIDINLAVDTAIGIAVLSSIGTASPEPEDDVAGSIITVPATAGGFDMTFGLFNFHVDNDGVTELISIGNSMPPAMAPTTSPIAEGNPSATALPTPLEEEPRPKDLTPSVGSNDFEDPPLSPTTAYCTDCDAYHFVGARDFSLHEIAGCEDPRGGTAAVYPMISECERALNALTLRTTRPTTLIMSKGCTQITHARTTTTSTSRLKGK